MRFLFALLIFILLIGFGLQQGWVDAAWNSMTPYVGAGKPLDPSVGIEGAMETGGSLAHMAVNTALDGLRSLPEPWRSLSIGAAGLTVIAFVVSFAIAVATAVLRVVGWFRDMLV
jgi:hypothetical protein